MTRSRLKKVTRTSGFSLVEMLIVAMIIIILTAGAIIQIKPMLKASRADAAVSYSLNQIRLARERAIDERRLMRVTFTAPQTIFMEYQFTDPVSKTVSYLPVTLQAGQTGAGIVTLPYDMNFIVPPTKPASAPDLIGSQTTALDFYCAGSACAGTALYFNPDGSITNVNNDPVQGVVYMARTGDELSARAVSFLGPTGRAKAWRFLRVPSPPAATPTQWAQQ